MMIIINDNIIIIKLRTSVIWRGKWFDKGVKMCDSIDFWKKPNWANMIGLFLNIKNQTNLLVMKKSNWSRVDYGLIQMIIGCKLI